MVGYVSNLLIIDQKARKRKYYYLKTLQHSDKGYVQNKRIIYIVC